MSDKIYDVLKLENQLCFPLYVASKEVVKKYRPYLDAIDLTYTQYIAMMVLWEEKRINVKELGERLYLDSGTLTPMLKSLERKGFIRRRRSTEDERVLIIEITDEGEILRDDAVNVPKQLSGCLDISMEDALQLRTLLRRLLDGLNR